MQWLSERLSAIKGQEYHNNTLLTTFTLFLRSYRFLTEVIVKPNKLIISNPVTFLSLFFHRFHVVLPGQPDERLLSFNLLFTLCGMSDFTRNGLSGLSTGILLTVCVDNANANVWHRQTKPAQFCSIFCTFSVSRKVKYFLRMNPLQWNVLSCSELCLEFCCEIVSAGFGRKSWAFTESSEKETLLLIPAEDIKYEMDMFLCYNVDFPVYWLWMYFWHFFIDVLC